MRRSRLRNMFLNATKNPHYVRLIHKSQVVEQTLRDVTKQTSVAAGKKVTKQVTKARQTVGQLLRGGGRTSKIKYPAQARISHRWTAQSR